MDKNTEDTFDLIVGDLLDEIVAERTAKNPEFPKLMEQAAKKRKMDKQVKVGVAIIVRFIRGTDRCSYEYAVLMGKRKGSHGAGTWSFPGGHVEFGESIEEAGKRELFEEAGIDIPIEKFKRMGYVDTIFKDQDRHYITLYLIVEWKKEYGQPKLMEPEKCEGWVWTTEKPSPLFEPIDNLKTSVWYGR